MFSELMKHPAALALSVLFHLLVIAAIFFNLHLSDKTVLVKQADLAKTVKAEVVDLQQLEAQKSNKKKEQEAKRKRELEKQKRDKEAKKREEEKKRKQEQEKKTKAAAEKKKIQEAGAKSKLEAEKKRKAEAKRIADAKKRAVQKRQEAEQLKKQQEKDKLAEEKLKQEEQLAREAEQKRLEEEAKKQAAEQRRLAEEEIKRRQQELNENLRAEESQRKLNSLREAYRLAIKQKIERNWRQPQESGKMPDCEVRVTQGPGGIILEVTFGPCQGGTPTYRASIENAVYKAEPLPKPGDASLFERELIILFNPG